MVKVIENYQYRRRCLFHSNQQVLKRRLQVISVNGGGDSHRCGRGQG